MTFLTRLIICITLLQLGVHGAAVVKSKNNTTANGTSMSEVAASSSKGHVANPSATFNTTGSSSTTTSTSSPTPDSSSAKSSGVHSGSASTTDPSLLGTSCSIANGLGKRACSMKKGGWQLNWISQRHLSAIPSMSVSKLVNKAHHWNVDPMWGSKVIIYVIDTGVDGTHHDFQNQQVAAGYDLARYPTDPPGDGRIDTRGHGTAVASAIVGQLGGVAHRSTIFPIKIDRDGVIAQPEQHSDIVADAVNYVVNNYISRAPAARDWKAIINMSLAVSDRPLLKAAVRLAIANGIHVVLTAGNEGKNECYEDADPSDTAYMRLEKVGQIVVGNTKPKLESGKFIDQYDPKSNYGSCVDIFAPGSKVRLAQSGTQNQYSLRSGTSFAVPLVSGTIAALLSSRDDYKDLYPIAFTTKFLHEFGLRKVRDVPAGTTKKRLVLSPGLN